MCSSKFSSLVKLLFKSCLVFVIEIIQQRRHGILFTKPKLNFSRQIALSPQFFALGGTALFYVSSDTRSVVLRRNHLLDGIFFHECGTIDKLTIAKGISSVNCGFLQWQHGEENRLRRTEAEAVRISVRFRHCGRQREEALQICRAAYQPCTQVIPSYYVLTFEKYISLYFV